MTKALPEGSARPAEDAVLRSAGGLGLALGGITTAVATAWGTPAVLGAAIGTVLTVAAFAAGPAVLRTSSRWSPPAAMSIGVGAFVGGLVVLWAAYLLLADATWLEPTSVGVAILASATGWLAGHVRAVGRLRVLAFGSPPDPLPGHDVAGHDGSGQSPGPTSH